MKKTIVANGEYEIKLYHPEFMSQVVNLLQHHWGGDTGGNLPYFRWKYVDNPYTESPPGIVAFVNSTV